MTAGPRRWVFPSEIVAWTAAAGALAYLRWHGLPYGWNTVTYLLPQMLRRVPLFLLIGVALRAGYHLVARRSARDFLRAVLRPGWLLVEARCWLALILVIYAYTWLKVSIPLVRDVLYDDTLWRLDRFVHFGLSPSVFAVELVAGTPLAGLLDAWYGLWAPLLVILTALFFAHERADLRRNFALATGLLWTLGVLGYLAWPSLGPCFASPDVLDPIRTQIPSAIGLQNTLWQQYLSMVRGRGGLLPSFQPLYGVAAMPSLHVGAHALFAFWARRHERWLFVPMAVATCLTFLGSIGTCWHYAIDGYAGVGLAWLAVRLADRFEPTAASVPAGGGEDGGGEQAGDQRDGDHQHAES